MILTHLVFVLGGQTLWTSPIVCLTANLWYSGAKKWGNSLNVKLFLPLTKSLVCDCRNTQICQRQLLCFPDGEESRKELELSFFFFFFFCKSPSRCLFVHRTKGHKQFPPQPTNLKPHKCLAYIGLYLKHFSTFWNTASPIFNSSQVSWKNSKEWYGTQVGSVSSKHCFCEFLVNFRKKKHAACVHILCLSSRLIWNLSKYLAEKHFLLGFVFVRIKWETPVPVSHLNWTAYSCSDPNVPFFTMANYVSYQFQFHTWKHVESGCMTPWVNFTDAIIQILTSS